MTTFNGVTRRPKETNKLELTAIRPEMTHEEVYQLLLAALKRQGIKVHGTK